MIVHVTDFFHPRQGGIEVQVGALAAAQVSVGWTVEVVTASPGSWEPPGPHGYPVHRVAAPLVRGVAATPHVVTSVWRLLDRMAPDIVHLHVSVLAPLAWAAAAWSVRRRVPAVVTVHSLWNPQERALYRTADLSTSWSTRLLVTAVSSRAAELVRRAAPGVDLVVVPNGIALEEWRTARPALTRSGCPDLHVVAVGRLGRRRRPLELLRVLHQAQQQLPSGVELRATVAGTGLAVPAMQRFMARHGLAERVRLTGWLDRAEVRDLLADADVFVNACPVESFGIATLEARTAGVPVVARRGTGVADFIRHDREGLLGDSTAELAQAVVLLAGDVRLRARLADYNRRNPPEAFAWRRVLAAWERCYAQATEKIFLARSHCDNGGGSSSILWGGGHHLSLPAGECLDGGQVVDPESVGAAVQDKAAGSEDLDGKAAYEHDRLRDPTPGQ